MKKRISATIILASAMMLTLMGCGDASAEATSETGEVTEVQTETNSDTDSKTEDKDIDGEAETGSEDASKTSDAAATSDEASFEYKGKTISFTDDAQAVMDALDSVGTQATDVDRTGFEVEGVKWNDWDMNKGGTPNISVATQDDNGKEIIGCICGGGEDFKTSTGISTGSSPEDIKAAYGEPSSIGKVAQNAENYEYKFDSFKISFFIMDGELDNISYIHNNYKGLN